MTPPPAGQAAIDAPAHDPLHHVVLKQLLAYPEHVKIHRVAGPEGTAALLSHLPSGTGIVFKLSSTADLAPVEARFAVTQRTAFISFNASGDTAPAPGVHVPWAPGNNAFRLFETQGHDRARLAPLLGSGKACACVAERDGDTCTACFAFENYGAVWEVGGVVTAPSRRRQGLGHASSARH